MFTDTLAILGSTNDDHGRLSTVALDRANAALKQLERLPNTKVILTGGFGERFNRTPFPHSFYLRSYLIDKGLDANRIVAELPSISTSQGIELLMDFHLARCNPLGTHYLITSEFHVERVLLLVSYMFRSRRPPHIIGARDSLDKEALQKVREHERQAIMKLKIDSEYIIGGLKVANL